MRATLRIALPFALAACWAVTVMLWVRSYWRVDKVWVQVLPKVAVEARLTPGRIVVGSAHSTAELPIAEVHWFSWPVETYFAEFIPPPENPLFCQFRMYNGTFTIPLWFLALLATLPNARFFRRLLARARLAVAAAYSQPKRPLIAVGSAGAERQSGPALQAVS